jgi:poly-gamma-glutamate capsule biosynthesis protein CapA/YwtB (metallophosphatase superfamily)
MHIKFCENSKALFLGFALALLTSCVSQAPLSPPPQPDAPRAKVLAVGDVMTHRRVERSAEQNGNAENFFYGQLLKTLQADIQAADVAFANLETPVAKKEYFQRRPFVFNASPQLPLALKWLGFDILSIANNHSLDQGKRGLLDTIEFLESNGIPAIGAGRNFEDASRGTITVINGLKIGWIGFTRVEGANWRAALNREKVWVNVSDTDEEIVELIQKLRQRCDVLIASIHWGDEYGREPRKWQRELAVKMHEAGALAVLGHHPHVLQEIKLQQINGKNVLTAFSLGNFLSNQGRKMRWPLPESASKQEVETIRQEGRSRDTLLLNFQVSQMGVSNATVTPLWTLNPNGKPSIQVVKIESALKDIQSKWIHSSSQKSMAAKIRFAKDRLSELRLLDFRLETIRKNIGTIPFENEVENKLKLAQNDAQMTLKQLLNP